MGGQWLSENELSVPQWQVLPHHNPLAQLLVASSLSLLEIMLFTCLKKQLEKSGEVMSISKLMKYSFKEAFDNLPQKLGCTPFDTSIQPIKSVEPIRLLRNEALHKESKPVTLKKAKSAFYSATQASIAIHQHFNSGLDFPHAWVVEKYPLTPQAWMPSRC